MASDVTSRETIRDRVVSLLSAALVGDGGASYLVEGIFNHEPSETELAGRTPVVWVKAAGISRQKIAETNTRKITVVRLFVHVAISIDAEDDLNPGQVEDLLDSIEKKISDTRFDNEIDLGFWDFWDEETASVAGYTEIGKEYRTEIFSYTYRLRDD